MKKFVSALAVCLAAGCATNGNSGDVMQALAILAAARPGGGGVQAIRPTVTDTQWEWDQFMYNGSLVWACRGVQTGMFADSIKCAGKVQVDWKWPGWNL